MANSPSTSASDTMGAVGAVGAHARAGRLLARPGRPTRPGQAGLQRLPLSGQLDVLLRVPEACGPEAPPLPLLVLLHGAGGTAQGALDLLGPLATQTDALLVAPASRGATWDVLYGGWGPDVETIDLALRAVFDAYPVDGDRLAIGGFSDGASYALSLGLTNGDLFSHVIGFSPGFVAPRAQRDKPDFFISHGTRDTVLRIDACSRRIVPLLEQAGYAVAYREFDGPHTVPLEIAREALAWFGAGRGPG